MVLRTYSSVHVLCPDADFVSVSSATVAIHHSPALLQLVAWITATAISDAAIAGSMFFLQSNDSQSMSVELSIKMESQPLPWVTSFNVMISSMFRRNVLEFTGVEPIMTTEVSLFFRALLGFNVPVSYHSQQ